MMSGKKCAKNHFPQIKYANQRRLKLIESKSILNIVARFANIKKLTLFYIVIVLCIFAELLVLRLNSVCVCVMLVCSCRVICVQLNWLLIKFTARCIKYAPLNIANRFSADIIIICQLIRANELCNRRNACFELNKYLSKTKQILLAAVIGMKCLVAAAFALAPHVS